MLAEKVHQPSFRTSRFIPRSMALRVSFQLLCIAIALWLLVFTYWSPDLSLPAIRYRSGDGSRAPATNSTLGFQKVFAISLPQRTDRQDALTLMSVLSGLEIDIAPGVRGEDVLEKTVPKVSNVVIYTWMHLLASRCDKVKY